jgi:hypothetical protein
MRTSLCSKMILLVPNNNKIRFFYKSYFTFGRVFTFTEYIFTLYNVHPMSHDISYYCHSKVGYCHCNCFCYTVTPRDVSESAVFNFKNANIAVTVLFYWRIFLLFGVHVGYKIT